MNLLTRSTVLIVLAFGCGVNCAIILPIEDRAPVFENIVQNNASTIAINGDQPVSAIAERTYTVPGTGRQIIFMSNADFERFANSLPGGVSNWQGFRRRLEPPSPVLRAEPYYVNKYRSSGLEYTPTHEERNEIPAASTSHPGSVSGPRVTPNQIPSSGSLQWDSSDVWYPPTTTTPSPRDREHVYGNGYGQNWNQNRESQYRGAQSRTNGGPYNYDHQPSPTWFQQQTTTTESSRDRQREREPYENVLGLHRNGVEHYNRDSESIPDDLLRHRRPVQPSRLRMLDTDSERRYDEEGYDYAPGYRRYSDYALGGRGSEYRAAAPASPPELVQHSYYNTPPSYEPSWPTTTTEAATRAYPPYYQYQPTRAPAPAYQQRDSKCCVVTWTCVLLSGYNGQQNRIGNQYQSQQPRKRNCGPRQTTTTTTTPRPGGDDGRSKCCCCVVSCC